MRAKTHIGGGTLKEFQADYAEIEALPERFKGDRMASQVFPVMQNSYSATREGETACLFEWVIYYSVIDNYNQQITKGTGKVETIATGEGGKTEIKEEQVKEPELVV